jgi:hypothetical protein
MTTNVSEEHVASMIIVELFRELGRVLAATAAEVHCQVMLTYPYPTFLRSVLQLLVTAYIVPSSLILSTPTM